jgi:2-polyprenyl-6-methoxyphenol hydroxylase-like FAD-dependent oxidoreductase
MSTKHPVLIIGAGIAGLALARVLQGKGISVDVYESSPRDASQGYGITLRSWAYGPLIEQLHVPFEDFCSAVATDGAVGGRGDINPTLHDALTGQPLVQAAPAKTGSPGGGLFRANRNRLRTFLLQGVNCHFEHSLASLDAAGEGNLVTARFSNGVVATGCVLIGADGVFSKGIVSTPFSFYVMKLRIRLTSTQCAGLSSQLLNRPLALPWFTTASDGFREPNSTL